MAIIYVALIVKGKRTFESVPALLKPQVKELLGDLELDSVVTEQGQLGGSDCGQAPLLHQLTERRTTMQIDVSLLISFLSLCVAGVVMITNVFRNKATDDKKEASETTTLIVKLENINSGVNEIKSDMRNMRGDIQDLRDRLIIVEQSTKSAHHRLNTMEGKEEEYPPV